MKITRFKSSCYAAGYGGSTNVVVRCARRRLTRKAGEFAPRDHVMDETQFLRLLGLFPMVRTRDYCADDVASTGPLLFSDFDTPANPPGTEQTLDSAERDRFGEQDSFLDAPSGTDSSVGAPSGTESPLNAPSENDSLNESHKISEEGSSVEAEPQLNGSRRVSVSFWDLLQQEVETKLGQAEAQRFCDAFRVQHNDLVNKTLSLDSIERIASKLELVQK